MGVKRNDYGLGGATALSLTMRASMCAVSTNMYSGNWTDIGCGGGVDGGLGGGASGGVGDGGGGER